MDVVLAGLLPALVGERQRERQRRVVEGEGRGAGNAARHVGDAIVHDAVDEIGRVRMGGGLRGLRGAALVDGDIDEGRALAMAPISSRLISFGAAAPGTSTVEMTRSAAVTSSATVSLLEWAVLMRTPKVAIARRRASIELSTSVTSAPMPRATWVALVPATTGAEDDNLGRGDTGDTAEQDALAASGVLEGGSADLRRHAAGDFRHRSQQRQRTGGRGHRLIGDAGGTGLDEVGGLLRIGREVGDR